MLGIMQYEHLILLSTIMYVDTLHYLLEAEYQYCRFLDACSNRAVACDVTSAAFNQDVWQNVWCLYRERCVLNYSVVVERVTAKPLWYDNRLSVGNNILGG